jgi:hypothetical protein
VLLLSSSRLAAKKVQGNKSEDSAAAEEKVPGKKSEAPAAAEDSS